MVRLEDYLQKLDLTEALIGRVMAVAHPFAAKREQRLLSPPQTCDRLFFIEEGIFREYKDLETETETEKTSWLLGEGNWLYSVESYITQNPSAYYTETIYSNWSVDMYSTVATFNWREEDWNANVDFKVTGKYEQKLGNGTLTIGGEADFNNNPGNGIIGLEQDVLFYDATYTQYLIGGGFKWKF